MRRLPLSSAIDVRLCAQHAVLRNGAFDEAFHWCSSAGGACSGRQVLGVPIPRSGRTDPRHVLRHATTSHNWLLALDGNSSSVVRNRVEVQSRLTAKSNFIWCCIGWRPHGRGRCHWVNLEMEVL